jgi:hypothetical protein
MTSIETDLGYKLRRAWFLDNNEGILPLSPPSILALAPSIREEFKGWNPAQASKKLWGPSNLYWDWQNRSRQWRIDMKTEILNVIFKGMYPDSSSARVRYMQDLKVSHSKGWKEAHTIGISMAIELKAAKLAAEKALAEKTAELEALKAKIAASRAALE